ncbi:MAG: CPBP family intramembrane metalloprotease [Brevundimonas sp.]|uniref:CPBP family intramembrane glutamic endopeptidase n=1 Tax=Brevundimonas sp. TaxID=1871086 RepID=UPI0025B9F3D7|nr:CPBP family intramembrane glutamic endopeptidase [Brevundimonas sp.]MBX3476958.1 CPBP family intramembrane metalloprotease [Brevundimonas sp.]
MIDRPDKRPIPWSVILGVLIGFPLIFWAWSQLLLDRERFSLPGVDFFVAFWAGTTVVYLLKIAVIRRLLAGRGWTLADVGLPVSKRSIAIGVGGYLVLALALFAFVEVSVRAVAFDPEKLANLPGLYPDTTLKRAVFLVMAFVAGLGEELTYRGFAIRGLASRGINAWLAIPLAAVPFVFQHGLKSLDQFWWFFGSGLVLGVIFVATKRLWPGIVLHWLIILSAMLGVFSAMAA